MQTEDGDRSSPEPGAGQAQDILDQIPNLFRLLDLVEDRSSGGLVEKVVIDQSSLRKFIDIVQPGSFKSISDIDLTTLDELSIKPIGIYGDYLEVAGYLKLKGCLSTESANILSRNASSGCSAYTLRSGIYLTMSPEHHQQVKSKVAYIVYWPEDKTWNDTATSLSDTLRRSRDTFMRYLTKLSEQIVGFFSLSQAQAFVWDAGSNNLDDRNQQAGSAAASRIRGFRVGRDNHDTETVTAAPGFQISARSIFASRNSDAGSNMSLIAGDDSVALLNWQENREGARTTSGPLHTQYSIYTLELTQDDRSQSQADETYVPQPRLSRNLKYQFLISKDRSIEFVKLVGKKCLLAISDSSRKITQIFFDDLTNLNRSVKRKGILELQHSKLGGSSCKFAFDQPTRSLAVIHGSNDICLTIITFNDNFRDVKFGAPIHLNPLYETPPDIAEVCFQAGRGDLCVIETSGCARIFSVSSRTFRGASVQINRPVVNTLPSPDGSCLLAVVKGDTPSDPNKLLAFHWDSFGSTQDGIHVTDIAPSDGPYVATRFYGRGRVHVISYSAIEKTVASISLRIQQKKNAFSFSSQNTRPDNRISTINNSLLDCFLGVWTRFPVVPAVERDTLIPITRQPRQLVIASPITLPQVATYFTRMISKLQQTTRKPVDQGLTNTIVWSTQATNPDFAPNTSEFKLGSFIVELFCLIPLHLAITMNNKLFPLKDGVWDSNYQIHMADVDDEKSIKSLSLGWYESLFQSYKANKLVRVVSSMGEQSVGKSYCLNHLSDTSFAGSAMRTTEGIWLSCTPTRGYLLVSLDFEGMQTIERSFQEDMLLVLFNTAISNLILFRNNFALSRNIKGLFTGFQLSTTTFDPEKNLDLFNSTLAIIIKDVVEADVNGIVDEFSQKFREIVEEDGQDNFITKLHRGKIEIIPWPVIGSVEFYSQFNELLEWLEQHEPTHGTAGTFLNRVKTLLVQIKDKNWDSVSATIATNVAEELNQRLTKALSHGRDNDGPLRNLETKEEIPIIDDNTACVFSVRSYGDGHQGAQIGEDLNDTETERENEAGRALKELIKFCNPSVSRHINPNSSYIDALQACLEKLYNARISHVKRWIDDNRKGLDLNNNNSGLLNLNQRFTDLTRAMHAAIRLCKTRCSTCRLLCLLKYGHPGEHHCETDHKCPSDCEVVQEHPQSCPRCSLDAGHEGRHMCNTVVHACGKDCHLSNLVGCNHTCAQSLDHEGEHACSAPTSAHICGKPCDLRNINQGSNFPIYTCSGICQKPWNEPHTQHSCDDAKSSRSCPIRCQLCNGSNTCTNTDHLHGLSPSADHLCGGEHACQMRCEIEGICTFGQPKSELVQFSGTYSSYKYPQLKQDPKEREPCRVRIPPGQLSHSGRHTHDPSSNRHTCKAQCPGCNYFCDLDFKHTGLHHTAHGSMIDSRWIVESRDKDYGLGSYRYGSGDFGDSMCCGVICQQQGRHVHVDWCRNNHNNPLCEHIHTRMEPEPHRDKDWISHATYWERTGFKDPYVDSLRLNFAKCDARCADSGHIAPSFCIKPIFHARIDQNLAPSVGYISQDGHQFECSNPTIVQNYHVVFVIDNSYSMSGSDLTPPWTAIYSRLTSKCNNRYGAVISACYKFWDSREAAQVTPTSRDDSYSVVVFDSKAEARVENDRTLSKEQLVDKLVPQRQVSGYGTEFSEAFRVAEQVINRNWDNQRCPIMIFLSDGEDSIQDSTVESLCNLCVRKGQALALYSISFGTESYSSPLRKMADIGKRIFRAAPSSAQGCYAGLAPPCDYFTSMDSIKLGDQFMRIAESLPRKRGAVLNKYGASGRNS